MVQFLSPKFYPKNGSFLLFSINQETTLLSDEEYISQKASYTAQQSSRMVKSPKV